MNTHDVLNKRPFAIVLMIAATFAAMTVFFVDGSLAHAQSDSCSAIMAYGVFNTESTFSSSDHFELFKRFVCRSQSSTKQEMEREGAKIGIGVGVYSLNF